MGKGLLLSVFEIAEADKRAFDDWLRNEYCPGLMALKGFVRGSLWSAADNPKLSIVTFDLESADVLKTSGYAENDGDKAPARAGPMMEKCRRLLQFEGEQISPGDQLSPADAGGMLLVASNAAPEFEAEYGDWYDREHLPALRAVPGTLSARRFRATRSSHRFLSLYHLKAPEVQASPAWKKAVDTPWSSTVRPQVRDRMRIVCVART